MVLGTITNPGAGGSTGTYTIRTTTAADVTLDEDAAVTADTIAGGGGGGGGGAPPAKGTITIIKTTDVFGFSGDLAALTLGAGESVLVEDLVAGDYSVIEADLPDWALDSINCGDATTAVAGSSVTITLAAGEDVAWTFSNRLLDGSISVVKAAVGSDGESFPFTGDLGSFSLLDGETYLADGLVSGDYQIAEVATLGWELASIDCGAAPVVPFGTSVTVTLEPEAVVVCLFTNQPAAVEPTLDVEVDVVLDVAADVDPDGLLVSESDGGGLVVAVPQLAIGDATAISVSATPVSTADLPAVPPSGTILVGGQALEINIVDQDGAALTEFDPPVQIAVQVDLTLVEAEGLSVFSYDPETGTYVQIPATVDAEGVVRFDTAHLSLFTVLELPTVDRSLSAGWNVVVFTGPSGTTPAAFAEQLAGVESLFRWDAASQSWEVFRPDGPTFANTLQVLEQRDPLFVRVNGASTLTTMDLLPGSGVSALI